MGINIPDSLMTDFNMAIDALIDWAGRTVILNMPPIETECTNCEIINIGGKKRSSGRYKAGGPEPFTSGICPVCRGSGIINTVRNVSFKSLVRWNPDEYMDIAKSVHETDTIVEMKTYRTNESNIKKAQYAIIDSKRCKRVKDPVPRGLRESRYCVTFWQVVNE